MAGKSNEITQATAEEICPEEAPADFEKAIDVAGYGLFNILLLLVALPAAISSVFETSSMSYILPSAECDLNLSLLDKGTLNAITYAGMISSAIIWGYVADTKGRKYILVAGYLVDTLCVFGGSFSQSILQLMIFKFLGGLVICGPFAVLMSYLTEIHSKKYRAMILMIVGLKFTLATLMLPALALTVLANEWNVIIFGTRIYQWQLFLAITAIPSFVSGMLFIMFPESPKFLMARGRNEEALNSLRTIYALNKFKPKDTYPIKTLVNELEMAKTASLAVEDAAPKQKTSPAKARNSFLDGIKQLQPLFCQPYLKLSLNVYAINFVILMGQNTIRLWLPQLFASITEYQKVLPDSATPSMCSVLEYSVNKTALILQSAMDESTSGPCEVVIIPETYLNNIIVGLTGLGGYLLAIPSSKLFGVKILMHVTLVIAASCALSLYWAASAQAILMISATQVTMGSIASTSVISSTVSIFPTNLRTMIVSLAMMFGRIGSIMGNILFPIFMSIGCFSPFLMISLVMFLGCLLSLFLPSTKKMALK